MLAVVASTIVTCINAAHADETPPLKIAITYGPGEKQLQAFGAYLESKYNVECSYVFAEKAKTKPKPKGDRSPSEFTPTPFSDLDALVQADVIVSNLYRTWAPDDQIRQVKRAFRSKPVVGIRKSHHGFQNWLSADLEVFGVDYKGDFYGKKGQEVKMWIVESQADNPLVKNAPTFLPGGGLYTHHDVKPDVTPLMEGGPEGTQPILQSWIRINKVNRQRVFYTRFDERDLAKDEGVRDFLVRAIFWAVKQDAAKFAK